MIRLAGSLLIVVALCGLSVRPVVAQPPVAPPVVAVSQPEPVSAPRDVEPRAQLSGPKSVEVGAPIVLNPSGTVAPGGLEFGLAEGPGPAPVVTLKSDDGQTVIGFGTAANAGTYRFYVVAYGTPGKTLRETPKQFAFWAVTVGKAQPGPVDPIDPVDPPTTPPTPPTTTATAATYVYEKDQHAVPNPVLAALNRLNRERGILATILEADTTGGTGQVPAQYKLPLAAAKEAGLPALVVTGGGKVIRTVKNPTTEQAVLDAIK